MSRTQLTAAERKRVLQDEGPRIRARMQRLGLSAEELLGEKATTPVGRTRDR